MRRLLCSFIKKSYACTRDAVQAQKAGGGGRAIRESPLRVPSAVWGMAVRAAFQAPVEPQLLSSLGRSCAAGAAALFTKGIGRTEP